MRISGVRLFDGREFSDGCTITLDGERIGEIARGGGAAASHALVTPGLIDAHVHLHQIAHFLGEAELQGAREPEEVVRRLSAGCGKGWALGNRLDHLHWRSRSATLKEVLDREFPETPVRILFSDGHSALLNEVGLQSVGAWRQAGLLQDLHLDVDAGGRATGIAADGNLELSRLPVVEPGAPPVGKDQLAAAIAECARHGVTAIHDLFVTVPEYLSMRDANLEGLRIFAYIDFQQLDELLRLRDRLGPDLNTDWLRVQGVKCFADGSLGSGGALLSEPYQTDPRNLGFEVLSTDEIRALAHRCLDQGLQLAVHALGDRGVANVLDAFEEALGASARSVDHRFRIEHAQVIFEEDIARCEHLQVVLSMQPYHFTDDGRWLPQRISPVLCKRASLWKRFVDAGIAVCFGSDAPFTNISAVDGIRSAVRRLETLAPEQRSFFSDGGLALDQALAGYSSGAAYAVFEEERLGRIAEGRLADLTLFDLELDRVLMTVVGGRITWMDDQARELVS
jgi:predicted amidohydrolase YtcJ